MAEARDDESDDAERAAYYTRVNQRAARIAFCGVGMILFGTGLSIFAAALGQAERYGLASMVTSAAFVSGFFVVLLAIVIRLIIFVGETRWRIATGRLKARHLWTDERPVPASTGRRMLRVFGRLAKNVGGFGFLALIIALVVIAALGPPGGRPTEMFLFYGIAGCFVLILAGAGASFVDGFLAGLSEEEDTDEPDQLDR